MKLKKFIFSTIFLLFSCEGLFAKPLPPGSGIGDVPANVLILLDKSGSMGWRMSGGAASMKYPYDTDADSSGNIIVSQYRYDGVKKFLYDTGTVDTGFGNKGVSGKGEKKYEGTSNCQTSWSYSGEVYNDVYYTTAYFQQTVVAINTSDGKCKQNYPLGFRPRNLTINKDTGYMYVSGGGQLKVYNLNNGSSTTCSGIDKSIKRAFGTVVNYSNGTGSDYLYSYYDNKIYRHTINNDSSKCPDGNTKVSFSYQKGTYLGLENDPTYPYKLYTLSWSTSKLEKITISATGKGYIRNWTKGARSRSASNASNLYFYHPWGLGWDDTNKRLLGSNLNNGQVHALDASKNPAEYLKSIGGAPKTRMQAAYEAIEAIMKDSSLTAGVNFGFGFWSSGSSGLTSWQNGDHKKGKGRARPCTYYNCLKVPVHKGGATDILKMIRTVNPGGGTHLTSVMRLASQYYRHSISPIDTNSVCQKSYVLVIGDGDWFSWTHKSGITLTKQLLKDKKVKTFGVAFGIGLSPTGYRYFGELAKAGGTEKAIVARTAADLTSQLKQVISSIIADKLSFTAPAITATIEQGGSLYQAQFDYQQNKEWVGTIRRTKINPDGSLDEKDSGNWSAAEQLKNPSSRKIWTPLPTIDYKTTKVPYNNFTDTYATEIANQMVLYGNDVVDYHRQTDDRTGSSLNRRCSSSPGVEDGIDDDVKGLINFIRGTDYFDYDGDCDLVESRKNKNGDKIYLGDIYHSQLLVIGAPTADTNFSNINQESYFRSVNQYDNFKNDNKNRDEVIYAGSNSGILHAIDASTGEELWGFVPPLLVPTLPLVMNVTLNKKGGGGSNAVFGVDGSIVSHDMFFKKPGTTSEAWYTILFVPYGRGGAGMSVLDVTNPLKPEHLWSIYNDKINHRVYRTNHLGNTFDYQYTSSSYSLASFEQAQKVTDNYVDSVTDNTCNSSLSTTCYKGRLWTMPVGNLKATDLEVIYNGKSYTNFSVSTTSAADTIILFGDEITYNADPDGDPSSELGVRIKPGVKSIGVVTHPEYDYSQLGETWSDPRIFRIPNDGSADTDILDDIYVAAMGGGFGSKFEGVGSNLTLINLQDNNNPGSLYRSIQIEDTNDSDIVNSVPASVVLVTPDTATGVNYSGGLVYLSDLEGKITKINLTNMSDDGLGNQIKIFDKTTLFNVGSNKTNGRYMYHAMDATIGDTTNTMWLFAGTGDYERVNDTSNGVENFMLGIKDVDYPYYRNIAKPATADKITKCQNTTDDTTGAKCPDISKKGWYITLKDFAKVTAEPTVFKGKVYFPVYEPTKSLNKCSLGEAYICATDDECGTNNSSQLGQKLGSGNKCAWVGQGVLSKIVTFADKLFANIAGQIDCDKIEDATKRKECKDSKKKDLISVDSASGQGDSKRRSWRQNF